MPFNLLLLPLLGGYIFVRKCYLTSLNVLRYDANLYRILLPSSIAGVILLIIAYIITLWLHSCYPDAVECWQQTVRLPFPYIGTSIIAFLLGASAWIPVNLCTNYTNQINKAIEKHNDPLERLLQQSFNDTSLVYITLKSDKVYIGWVTNLPQPGVSRYISIVPVMSGFRNKDDKRVKLTTPYLKVLEMLFRDKISFMETQKRREGRNEANLSNKELRELFATYRLVISFADILTTTTFEPRAYAQFGDTSTDPMK